MTDSSHQSRQHSHTTSSRGLKHRPQGASRPRTASQGTRQTRPRTAAQSTRQTRTSTQGNHTTRPHQQASSRTRQAASSSRVRTTASSQQRVRTSGGTDRNSTHNNQSSTSRSRQTRLVQNGSHYHTGQSPARPRRTASAEQRQRHSGQNPQNRLNRPQQQRRRPPQGNARRPQRPNARRPKKKPFILRHPKGFAIFIGIIAAAIAIFFFILTRTTPLVFGSSSMGISSEAASQARHHRIVNVLLLGTDGRNSSDHGRSDTIMILSGDFEHKKLKLTSLMRDTYVSIPDHDMNKLNAAYSFGAADKMGDDAIDAGAEAALHTVNQNFDMAMTDYITVDFTCTAKVVDAVGGVDIDIKSDAERQLLNKYLSDTTRESGGTITANPVNGTGKQHLSGAQALAYSRIRYVGNGDFERTQRQRTVFQQVFKKAKKMSVFKQYHLYKTVKPYIHTSLSGFTLFKYLFNVALIHNSTLEQQQIPDSSQVSVGTLHGVSYVFPETLETNIETLHQFIFEEAFTASDTARDISEKIQEAWPY